MTRCFWSCILAFALPSALLPWTGCSGSPNLRSATQSDRAPRIDPDYTSLVIPPNIAPLNFRILEDGCDYVVRISSDAGEQVDIPCSDGTCRLPIATWRRFLQASRGKRLYFDVFAQRDDGSWIQFRRIANSVAQEPIDSHIVYRLLTPNKSRTSIRGIFQRDLESFRESALVTKRDGTFTCFNCHSFHQHDPDRFLFHVRQKNAGMMLVTDGTIRKINTRQEPAFRPLAYTSWHPGGRHVAGTCNMFISHFPSNARLYYFEAIEKRGDLMVYDIQENTLSSTEAVFGHEFIETHPCWSPDGDYIYYARGKSTPVTTPDDWAESRFDLMRIACNVDTNTWGAPETVKAYSEIGQSCAFPRVSPCGKYVLHILSDKSTYPIHQKSSDVYLLELASSKHRRLDTACSDFAESYPRWSSNGRWFIFVSNRRDGISALPYLAYFDTAGKCHKAFVLPQKDPAFFDTFIETYNVVELVRSRVSTSAFKLAQGMQQPPIEADFPQPPQVDAYTGPTKVLQTGYY